MPYYRFSEDDVFYNRLKTHPSCHFITWKGCTYYNNQYTLSGTLNDPGNVKHISSPYTSSCNSGFVSLYEMNIDRPESLHNFDTNHIKGGGWHAIPNRPTGSDGAPSFGGRQTMIYPFMTKGGTKNSLKSVTYDSYVDDFSKGDIISGSYPLSASIKRIFHAEGSAENGNEVDPSPHESGTNPDGKSYYYQNKEQVTVKTKNIDSPEKEDSITDAPKLKKAYIQALKETINYYKNLSPHYIYSSSIDPITGESVATGYTWDKSYQALSIIDVPTIFYGSSIKKGTVNLKYYITGTLIGELQDSKRNGELIQVGPSGSFKSGSVAGIILYNEGALILTGAWDLTSRAAFTGPQSQETGLFGPPVGQDYQYFNSGDSPSWIFFGTGMNDGYPNHWDASQGQYTTDEGDSYKSLDTKHFLSSSFELLLSGTNYIPTITMMAHAKRGYLNWSNNPTYIKHGQPTGSATGSTFYKEHENVNIKNTISSSFACDYTASFKKQTFINKIGIYDENKNLIAIAKMATPVRKLETDEYTFKLKLDF